MSYEGYRGRPRRFTRDQMQNIAANTCRAFEFPFSYEAVACAVHGIED